MPPKRRISSSHVTVVALATAMVGAVAGCSSYAINPFADEAVPREDMMSPSERAARVPRENQPVNLRKREYPETEVVPVSGAVVHWPLWWEDPFEDKGSDDGQFAWTAEDYLAMPYSFARFILNTTAWPASAVVTPPGTPMISDGKLSRQILGYDHDAIPLSHANRETQGGVEDRPLGATNTPNDPGFQRAQIETEELGPPGENANFLEDLPPLDRTPSPSEQK